MKCAIFLMLSLISYSSYAANALDQLANSAKNTNSISGKFTQSRHIAVLSIPIRSSGEFHYQRQNGLIWKVNQPVESTLEVSYNNGLRMIDDKGNTNPISGTELLTQLFLGIFSGNLTTLLDTFNIEEREIEKSWQLHLTPKSDVLRQHINYIDITGQHSVNFISVQETNGDRNEIYLIDQKIKRSAE